MKPLPDPDALLALVKKQVLSWTAVKVRAESEVEKIWPLDAAEEERTWADTAEEEAEVKLDVSEMLWDELLNEIAQELVDLDKSVSLRKKLELVEEKTRVSGSGAATHGLGSLQPLRPLGGGLQPLRPRGHL